MHKAEKATHRIETLGKNGQAKSKGNFSRSWKMLQKHRLAIWGFRILIVFYILVIFAEIFAPYPYNYNQKNKVWHPPTPIHFWDETGFSFRPFVHIYEAHLNQMHSWEYRRVNNARIYLEFFADAPNKELWGLLPIKFAFIGLEDYHQGSLFLLGADQEGRDIFSRILFGGRISLSVGIVGVFISFSIGMLLGGVSGYFGGKTDAVIMRLSEMIMMTPGFYLMLALRASFPDDASSTMIYLLIVVIMSFIGWAGLARVIRGMVLSLKKQTFVEAARAYGASHLWIISRHILPGTFSYAIVAATLSIPAYILGESALSLLTLGIQEPEASWGNMLAAARDITTLQLYPWVLWPGFFIFLTVMSYNFLGDGLRDALDPNAGSKR